MGRKVGGEEAKGGGIGEREVGKDGGGEEVKGGEMGEREVGKELEGKGCSRTFHRLLNKM